MRPLVERERKYPQTPVIASAPIASSGRSNAVRIEAQATPNTASGKPRLMKARNATITVAQVRIRICGAAARLHGRPARSSLRAHEGTQINRVRAPSPALKRRAEETKPQASVWGCRATGRKTVTQWRQRR